MEEIKLTKEEKQIVADILTFMIYYLDRNTDDSETWSYYSQKSYLNDLCDILNKFTCSDTKEIVFKESM